MENLPNVKEWIEELQNVSRPAKIKILSSFFKTGKGEYGEGDIFIGVTVPDNRAVAKKYYILSLDEIKEMLQSPIHEHRLSALIALVEKYRKTKEYATRTDIVNFYLANSKYINNWDLVDLSCPKILGEYTLASGDSKILYKLSDSTDLWEKRIAIVSTMTQIRKCKFDVSLDLCEKYLSHPHDLIHKATGWMLREIGKKDEAVMLQFVNQHIHTMPRTTLRYAIERIDPALRKELMAK